MKKVCVVLAMISLLLGGNVFGALVWDAPPVDLAGYGMSANWLVFMYQDVGDNSSLGTIGFNQSGATAFGTGYSDDIFMGASYQTTLLDYGGGVISFNGSVAAGWEATYANAHVYTVAINSTAWGTATQTRIFDSTTETLGATDPYGYAVDTPANGWQTIAVPEPTTLALLALGGLAVVRRKRIRA